MPASLQFNIDVVGAPARSAAEKLADIVSVKDFGAVGRGTTWDDEAIQRAIDAIIAEGVGATLYFPAGVYKLRNAIRISNPRLVNLLGAGRLTTTLLQTAPDTPGVRLTDCTAGVGFRWEGLCIRREGDSAGPTETQAVGIRFETGAGAPGVGYFNFSFSDIAVIGFQTCISNVHGSTPPNVWGWVWTSLWLSAFAVRAYELTNVGTGGGSPNCVGAGWYIQGRPQDYLGPIGYCDCADGWLLSGLEYNIGHFKGDSIFSFSGARNVTVINTRVEAVQFSTFSTPSLFFAHSGVYLTVQGVTLAGGPAPIVPDASVTLGILRVGANSKGSLKQVQVTNASGVGVIMPVLSGSKGQVTELAMLSPSAGVWIGRGAGGDSPYAPLFELRDDGGQPAAYVLGVELATIPTPPPPL